MPAPPLTTQQASRRYAMEFSGVLAIYAVAVFAALTFIPMAQLTGPALYAAALAPAVPIALIFVVMGRYLTGADEYVRGRLARSLLISAAIVLSAATAWDFLRISAGAPAIPPFVLGPGFFGVLGLVQAGQALVKGARAGEG